MKRNQQQYNLSIYLSQDVKTFLLNETIRIKKKSEIEITLANHAPRVKFEAAIDLFTRVNRVYACGESPVRVGRPASLMT